MTTDESTIVRALNYCIFQPGSYTRRFVRTLASMQTASELTPRQAEYLWRAAWSYRRQLPRHLVKLAGRYSGRQGITKRERPKGQPAPPSIYNSSAAQDSRTETVQPEEDAANMLKLKGIDW